MRNWITIFLVAFLLIGVGTVARGQEDDPDSEATTSSTKTTTQTVEAILVALTPEGRFVRLRPLEANGTPFEAVLDPDAKYFRDNQPANLMEFQPGDRVVARLTYRYTPDRTVILRELSDKTSFDETKRRRTTLCVGTVASLTPAEIRVVRKSDNVLLAFRITAKTQVIKDGQPVTLAAFPVGAPVAVKPRGLPGGTIMATIIAPTPAEADASHLDTLIRWEGRYQALEPDARGSILTLRRDDGVIRKVLVVNGANVRRGSKPLMLNRVPLGSIVHLHLVKNKIENGLRLCDEVYVPTRQ